MLQADSYNFRSPVFTCAIISNSRVTIDDIQVPITETYEYTDLGGVKKRLTGAVDLGQILTIAKERIVSKRIAALTKEMPDINKKILNALGLREKFIAMQNEIASLKGKILYLKGES